MAGRRKLLWVYNKLRNCMSFILIPNHGEGIQINAWNWRPTILLLHQANLIDEQQHELLGHNGCGASVSSEAARKIADFMEQQVAKMTPGQRLRGDSTITSEPKKTSCLYTHVESRGLRRGRNILRDLRVVDHVPRFLPHF